jgi:hypothetical protein
MGLSQQTQPHHGQKKRLTEPSENWSSGEANRQQGRAWLDQIYKANHASTENTLAAHKDFGA